ncbi:expressed unknown protein [Seminavis robusta]|uniref:SMP-LTD domain-containing protein n=1 Tax=Seminavis robusta TaxID=568900 RepID=A0A9N8HRF7_9STRA|nr:expressed unknown protein [Seminavis robusta]|eukprot:Sro1315_g262080.1 n/a (542) ;mRNA; f:25221-26846
MIVSAFTPQTTTVHPMSIGQSSLHPGIFTQVPQVPQHASSRRRPLMHPALFTPYTATTPLAFQPSSSTALHSFSPVQMAGSVATSPSTASFLRLAVVFVAGGLFCSSAVAACAATYAIGKNNLIRFSSMAFVLWRKIWMTFTTGLSDTRNTLLLDEPTTTVKQQPRYKKAWRVLKTKMRETRQEAVEGVQAIRTQVQLCSAAVGPAGLIPMQYMLDRLLPYNIEAGVKAYLEQAMDEIPSLLSSTAGIKKLQLSHFSVGGVTPKLEAARMYDVGPNAMAMECDVTWESELEATVQVHTGLIPPKVPVTVKNVRFQGPVRIVFAPLTQKSQFGFGATLVSFPSMPEIGLDVSVAGGEVTKLLPLLRSELISAIKRQIGESMIWPKRAVIPSVEPDNQIVLSPEELKALEVTDPLLEAEQNSRPMLRNKLNQMSDVLEQDHFPAVDLPMPSFAQDHQMNVDKPKTKEAKASPAPQPEQDRNNVPICARLQQAQAKAMEQHRVNMEQLGCNVKLMLQNGATVLEDIQSKINQQGAREATGTNQA